LIAVTTSCAARRFLAQYAATAGSRLSSLCEVAPTSPAGGDVDAVKPEPAEIVDRSPFESVSITLIIHDGAEQTLGSRNVNHGCRERCHAQPALVGGGLED
jgi:hypothetical protein